MSHPTTKDRETPTDFLVRAMEMVEGVEDIIVVYRKRDENNRIEVDWAANGVIVVDAMGMLEVAKLMMFHETADFLDDA